MLPIVYVWGVGESDASQPVAIEFENVVCAECAEKFRTNGDFKINGLPVVLKIFRDAGRGEPDLDSARLVFVPIDRPVAIVPNRNFSEVH